MRPQNARGSRPILAQPRSSTTQLCGLLRKGTGFDHAYRYQARRDDRLLLGSGARLAGDFCFPRVSVEARMSFEQARGALPLKNEL